MGRSLTAEEAKKQCIDSMGKDLGEYYYYLWQDLVWLYSKWFEYLELFGKTPSRIELLNEAAPYFFKIIQDVLWEDIILGIARIIDSPQSCGKDNLTIQKLPDYIHDKVFKIELKDLINQIVESASFCRDWRNRRLAHRDLLLRMEKETKGLEPISREKTNKTLHSIGEVLNNISYKYLDSTTVFNFSSGEPGNASALLYIIYDGLKLREERENRIQQGIYKEEDFDYPDI